MAMNYIETEVDPFFTDWFKFKTIDLKGYLRTIHTDGVNEPYVFYQYDTSVFPPDYHNMVVIDVINNCIVKNADKITEHEAKQLKSFISANKNCLLKYWETYNTDELCEDIKL